LVDDLACCLKVAELGVEGSDPVRYHAVGDVRRSMVVLFVLKTSRSYLF